MGRTYNELYPIETMLAFLAIRGNKHVLGHWESAAYQLYIHTPRESLARLSTLISSGSKKMS